MIIEAQRTFAPPQTGIRQELIGNIQELARLEPPVREALFGSLTDHLIRVSLGRPPDRLAVVQEIVRLKDLREKGVVEDVFWQSALTSDSYLVGTIRRQVPVDELRMDPPGALWSTFLEAVDDQVPEFRGLKPEKRMSVDELGRIFLRRVDPTWAGGSWRLLDIDDWTRYKNHRDLVQVKIGLPFGAIRHLELTGVRVVIDHCASKLGWGAPEITNLTSRLVQELQVRS